MRQYKIYYFKCSECGYIHYADISRPREPSYGCYWCNLIKTMWLDTTRINISGII